MADKTIDNNALLLWANLTLGLLLELCALGALAFGAWHITDQKAARIVLAIGVPLAAAIAWGLYASPKARYDSFLGASLVRSTVFGGAAISMYVTGHGFAAAAFAIGVIVNSLLAQRLGQLER